MKNIIELQNERFIVQAYSPDDFVNMCNVELKNVLREFSC